MKDKYKTLIKCCWVVLLCCFVVKLLGGNYFETKVFNQKLIEIFSSKYSFILEFILSVIIYTIGTSLYVLAILKTKIFKNKQLIIPIVIFMFSIVKALFYKYSVLMAFIEIFVVIIMPMFYIGKRWYRSIIGYLLLTVFQIISLLTKNFAIKVIDENFLIALIFSIDYYIMIVLYYLYSIKEENENGKIRNLIFRFSRQR